MTSTKEDSSRGAPAMCWWAFPSKVALFVHAPIYLVCQWVDEGSYALYKHPVKFLVGNNAFVGLMSILAFAAAARCFEPGSIAARASFRVEADVADRALNILFATVLTAYSIFLLPIVTHAGVLLEHLRGSPSAMYALRETLNRIPGVTTLVTLQSLCIVLAIIYPSITGQNLPRLYRRLAVIMILACVLRAWLWSERLALIEIGLPACVAMFARLSSGTATRRGKMLAFAPLAGAGVLILVFAIGEYFRSWQFYKFYLPLSFWEFILVRLSGYYATALNNGAAMYALTDTLFVPTMTAEWYYRLPFWPMLGGFPVEAVDKFGFLEAYLNPEFNNTSGIFMPLLDFGPVFGILCWTALGAFSGWLMRSFANGDVAGMIFYPVWFTGIAEMLRVFYWGDGRFFSVIAGAIVLAWYFRRANTSRVTALKIV